MLTRVTVLLLLTFVTATVASAEAAPRRGCKHARLWLFGCKQRRPPPPTLEAAQLLTVPDIGARTGYQGAFEVVPLDEPRTATSSTVHFKAIGESQQHFDVAIRLWHARGKLDELAAELPSVDWRDEIGARSFRAHDAAIGVRGVAFADERRGLTVLVLCGDQQCDDFDDVVALARRAAGRIELLAP